MLTILFIIAATLLIIGGFFLGMATQKSLQQQTVTKVTNNKTNNCEN